MSKKHKKKKNYSTKNIVFLATGVFVISCVLLSTIYTDIRDIRSNNKQTKELNNYYNDLLEEQASLNSEVIKLQDPEYIARYAREKYLFTKDGETILKIVDGHVVTPKEKPVVEENEGDTEE